MTQEQKDILLKDLCARLPYGVKVQSYDLGDDMEAIETLREIDSDGYVSTIECDTLKHTLKPYLFPLSSMTWEQGCQYREVIASSLNHYEVYDWLNKNHFDYRSLIEKGLAIDATGLSIY